MAIKILIGGSPCTYWSIAQKNNRETEASGMGWELFKNYLIAKEKFKPDLFLYENNKSAAQAIKDQIAKELGVGVDPDVRFTYINSALVSAQNRQRFYVTNFGDIEQPEDRGILLNDILETGVIDKEKAYCLKHQAGNVRDYFKKHHTQIACEPVEPLTSFVESKLDAIVEKYGYLPEKFNPYNASEITDKSPTQTANCASSTNSSTVMITEPVRVGCMPSPDGTVKNSQAMRVYDVDGKSVNLTTTNQQYEYCGVLGYATPCEWDDNGNPVKAVSGADGKTYTVYEVKDGQITIKGKQYPVKLADGYYIIRKLTVRECARLQTMPDDYCKAVSDSQAYKALGNGWTAEVIIHLLNHALKDVPRDEEIIVLSMYDGIATGRYCLDKMGFTNVTYHAYEIDKYPIMVAMDNYPDIIQHGDAFAVREDDWSL
jgi:DNA (cytosine-5)-methyltransferase 3A